MKNSDRRVSSLHYVVFISFLLVFVQWSMLRPLSAFSNDVIAFARKVPLEKDITSSISKRFCKFCDSNTLSYHLLQLFSNMQFTNGLQMLHLLFQNSSSLLTVNKK